MTVRHMTLKTKKNTHMKNSLFLWALVFAFATYSCTEDSGLTEAEIVDGLKTALNVGTDSTVKKSLSNRRIL
jgi:hypothetical protein